MTCSAAPKRADPEPSNPADPSGNVQPTSLTNRPRAVGAAGGTAQGAITSMSTQQRSSACLFSVDPSTVDVLRRQTLVVLEANHYFFEELLSFGPEAQFALSVIYRDAFAVLDAIGWAETQAAGPVDVPLTAGHIDQLRRCSYDLRVTNINRSDHLDTASDQEAAAIRDDLVANLAAVHILDHLISDFAQSTSD
jgi:hypothetical protein